MERVVPALSERTIRRTFADLEEKRLLLTGNYNQRRGDTAKWYAVNYEKLAEIAGEIP